MHLTGVSTDSAEQLASYDSQVAHYKQKIEENLKWELAKVYSDAGISGTTVEKENINTFTMQRILSKNPSVFYVLSDLEFGGIFYLAISYLNISLLKIRKHIPNILKY